MTEEEIVRGVTNALTGRFQLGDKVRLKNAPTVNNGTVTGFDDDGDPCVTWPKLNDTLSYFHSSLEMDPK